MYICIYRVTIHIYYYILVYELHMRSTSHVLHVQLVSKIAQEPPFALHCEARGYLAPVFLTMRDLDEFGVPP